MKIFSILIFAFASLFFAQGARAALVAHLTVEGVTPSRDPANMQPYTGYQACVSFQGTQQGSTVWLRPEASGGSDRYSYSLIWRFGPGYQDYGMESQFQVRVKMGRSYGLWIPRIDDEIPYVQQSVLLIARDQSTGETASAEVRFTVSRGVILSPSVEPSILEKNCFERFPSIESTIGVLTNGSTNLSSLTIKQGIDRIWGSSTGISWGFFVSPVSLIPGIGATLGNLFSINRNYFTLISKQTSETVEVSTGYQLSPGDWIQIYTQKTRYITHYDAALVGPCGEQTRIPGAFPMQWWGFAYHAVPINPFDTARPDPSSLGARPVNTCPGSLSPGSGTGDSLFFRTNF